MSRFTPTEKIVGIFGGQNRAGIAAIDLPFPNEVRVESGVAVLKWSGIVLGMGELLRFQDAANESKVTCLGVVLDSQVCRFSDYCYTAEYGASTGRANLTCEVLGEGVLEVITAEVQRREQERVQRNMDMERAREEQREAERLLEEERTRRERTRLRSLRDLRVDSSGGIVRAGVRVEVDNKEAEAIQRRLSAIATVEETAKLAEYFRERVSGGLGIPKGIDLTDFRTKWGLK